MHRWSRSDRTCMATGGPTPGTDTRGWPPRAGGSPHSRNAPNQMMQMITKFVETRCYRRWRHLHQVAAGREFAGAVELARDLPQLPADPVAGHGVSHRTSDGIGHPNAIGVVIGCTTKAKRAASTKSTGFAQEIELPPIPDRFDQALSLCRPLSRRERMTLRPARSDMRCRKPCFFERRRLLG